MENSLIRVVLDILKPHSPSLPSFAMYLSSLDGVDGVNITLEGKDLNYDKIREAVENYGASIHSIDEVVAGKRLVEEVTTPQD